MKPTLTANELLAQLAAVVENGHGERPVYLLGTDDAGNTLGQSIARCESSQDYDGEVVWIY